MEEPLHERLMGIAHLINSDDYAKKAIEIVSKELDEFDAFSGFGLMLRSSIEHIADEIESEYVTKAQHDSEVKAIVEAQKGLDGSTYSAEYVIKTWADHHSMPMKDGECITEWLDRWFIKRPRFEDGEIVEIGKPFLADNGQTDTVRAINVWENGYWAVHGENYLTAEGEDGEFVKRPAAEVYDADGVEIKVGDVVYSVNNGSPLTVEKVIQNDKHFCGKCSVCVGGGVFFPATEFTNERPVFDAEGERIRKGDTVWTKDGGKGEVVSIHQAGEIPARFLAPAEKPFIRYERGRWNYVDEVTHREPDSLEKLRDDIRLEACNQTFAPYEFTRNRMTDYADRFTALIERGA